MLKTSLLGNELREKFYVTLSYLWFKPWLVAIKTKVSYRIDVGAEDSFENVLSYVLYSISIMTEPIHIKNWDGRAALDDLTEKTDQLHPNFFTQIIHVTQLYVWDLRAHGNQSGQNLLLKRCTLWIEAVQD